MTLGNVSALVSFVTMTRPPVQQVPPDKKESVALGEKIFTGTAQGTSSPLYGQMCATCHSPSLTLSIPINCIDNPGLPEDPDCAEITSATLVNPLPAGEYPRARKRFDRLWEKLRGKAEAAAKQRRNDPWQQLDAEFRQLLEEDLGNCAYKISLNETDLPNYALPRLKANADGTITVPLFSDLRLHDMGTGLQDVGSQGADVMGVSIPPRLFLTRPLWGVGDTQPWLHDARALTLMDAIMDHMSEGSEANPVIEAFEKLNDKERQAVVDFLESLRLPVQQGLKIEY